MLLDQFAGRHVLMLQGPNGPFFRKVAAALRRLGARVTKVNLNAADLLFYPGPDARSYRGRLSEFGDYIGATLQDTGADCLILFGDERPYHREAIKVAKARDIDFFVFEEGYIRPDFVTFEKGGVNGNSSLPRKPSFYKRLKPKPLTEPRPVGNTFWWAAWWALLNSLAITFLWFLFPRYRHHRDVNFFRQTSYWLRGGARKVWRKWRDGNVTDRLSTELSGKYFLVPLQVEGDSQIGHSRFKSISEFLDQIVRSFAAHAPRGTCLVVKDHPMGRPYTDYTAQLRRLGFELGIADRILHIDCVHLPTVLRHARGTVVINSTVGLSSVYHGTPTKCLGTAVYDIAGLTHQGPLGRFWRAPTKVEGRLHLQFHWYVREHTQIEGSVWTDLFWVTDWASASPQLEVQDRVDRGHLAPDGGMGVALQAPGPQAEHVPALARDS